MAKISANAALIANVQTPKPLSNDKSVSEAPSEPRMLEIESVFAADVESLNATPAAATLARENTNLVRTRRLLP